MGWSDCGKDSTGRPIGYGFPATCDHPGCDAKIDRGLSYVCGSMHGEDEWSCERYFCEQHKRNYVYEDCAGGRLITVCDECAAFLLGTGEWGPNEDGDILRRSDEAADA